eukprot:1644883-Prymnesium_polylepis.1
MACEDVLNEIGFILCDCQGQARDRALSGDTDDLSEWRALHTQQDTGQAKVTSKQQACCGARGNAARERAVPLGLLGSPFTHSFKRFLISLSVSALTALRSCPPLRPCPPSAVTNF